MARELFLNIRIAREEMERLQRAAEVRKMTVSRLVRDSVGHVTDRILESGAEEPQQVHASTPVQEVSQRAQPEPSGKPTLTELMQPGQKYFDEYVKLTKGRVDRQDFMDFLGDVIEYVDDRKRSNVVDWPGIN